jgi:hypothetical protein
MMIQNFNQTVDYLINELEQYDFNCLCAKPSADSWSLGQMYLHLIYDTTFFIQQIEICISNNDHAIEEASSHAKELFRNDAFPDERIEGAPSNAYIPQPESKEQLMNGLTDMRSHMNRLASMISETSFNGKAKHPGLDYFNAAQWLQFADMHLRHHLKQKKRLDAFLGKL